MGKWIYDKAAHTHDRPSSGSEDKPAGSIWECSCGAWFRLVKSKWEGDQRDWWYSYEWYSLVPGSVVQLNDGSRVTVGKPNYTGDTVLGGYRDR